MSIAEAVAAAAAFGVFFGVLFACLVVVADREREAARKQWEDDLRTRGA